jgi:hypothetical protein
MEKRRKEIKEIRRKPGKREMEREWQLWASLTSRVFSSTLSQHC